MKDGIRAREGLSKHFFSCSGGRPRTTYKSPVPRWCVGCNVPRTRNVRSSSGDGVKTGSDDGSVTTAASEARAAQLQRRAFITLSVYSVGMCISYTGHCGDNLTREQRIALLNVTGPRGRVGGADVTTKKEDIRATGRMQSALQLLKEASDDQARGEFQSALKRYKTLVLDYQEFEGLAERGRVGQALMEYQLGMVNAAILHLEDEEVALRGLAEVHAALASVLYVERPERLPFAELQWDIACEFDTRYSSVEWVRKEKKWPPKMLQALESFLSLKSV